MHKLVILSMILNSMPALANRLFITETGKYSSIDPIDGDSTENILISRMLYATPLQPKNGHELESLILESFGYNTDKNCLEFQLKENLKFSNNNPINIYDLEMSILRMVYKRPDFPIISDIKGVSDWIKTKYPLENNLDGIKVENNKLRIYFKEKVEHPLFRFSLELFGIVPKSFVDIKTGKLKDGFPTSGPYIIKKENSNSIDFELRPNFKNLKYPDEITFEYTDIKKITRNEVSIKENDVVYANELLMDKNDFETIQKSFNLKKLPASRFAALSISANSKTLNSDKKRRWFRDQFQQIITKEFSKTFNYEPSIFTELLPGYQPPNSPEFIKKMKTSYKLEGKTITLGKFGKAENKILYDIIGKLSKSLKIKEFKIIEYNDKQKLTDDFNAGLIDLYSSSSGFWPVSPVQDLKMLFTPGLHGLLKHQQEDKTFQKLIKKVVSQPTRDNYLEINKHLFQDATFNVYRHVSRLYFGKNKKQINQIPVGYLSANPWHIFLKN